MFSNLKLTSQNKILLISFVVFIFLYFILNSKNREASKEELLTEKKRPLYADTLIPKGQVLIPIELANAEAVAGLIDQYGMIDLYSGVENNSVLIASRIKILRAPLNQNQYAVMVSETHSREIMKFKGPFVAVVQNRFAKNDNPSAQAKTATELISSRPAIKPDLRVNHIEIEYYQGGN